MHYTNLVHYENNDFIILDMTNTNNTFYSTHTSMKTLFVIKIVKIEFYTNM